MCYAHILYLVLYLFTPQQAEHVTTYGRTCFDRECVQEVISQADSNTVRIVGYEHPANQLGYMNNYPAYPPVFEMRFN